MRRYHDYVAFNHALPHFVVRYQAKKMHGITYIKLCGAGSPKLNVSCSSKINRHTTPLISTKRDSFDAIANTLGFR